MNEYKTQLKALEFANYKVSKAAEQKVDFLVLLADGAINETDNWFQRGHDELEELKVLPDLSQIPNLKGLDISFTKIEVINELSHFKYVEELYLCQCPIVDADAIGFIQALRILDLSETKVKNINFLNGNKNIEKLDISCTDVFDLEGIEDCLKLQEIRLENTKVRHLPDFSEHTSLTHLGLANCSIDDLSHLVEIKQLKWIHIDDSQVDTIRCLSLRDDVKIQVTVNRIDGVSTGLSPMIFKEFVKSSTRDRIRQLVMCI